MERKLHAGNRFLLNHPFYRDWTDGKLCERDLAVYAAEYLYFVRDILPVAWERLGFGEISEEEREHAALWEAFGKSFNYDPEGHPATGSMKRLKGLFDEFKHDRPSLVGFLYAFEHQQPEISRTKLEGLERWFNVEERGKEYFREHSGNSHEVEILEREMAGMTDGEFVRCRQAFDRTVNALWDLLTDIQRMASEVAA